jgi:hypothetical protein
MGSAGQSIADGWDVLRDSGRHHQATFFEDHRGGLGRRSAKARQQL